MESVTARKNFVNTTKAEGVLKLSSSSSLTAVNVSGYVNIEVKLYVYRKKIPKI